METTGGNSLLQMCIAKVAQNMDVLERKVLNLPVSLLRDLLPHLNIYYLDRIETAAATKGISTSVIWEKIWKGLDQTWRWKVKSSQSDQSWKQRCLERLFHMLMFTQLKREASYLSNLSDSSVLSITVKHVKVLSLHTSTKNICRLASGDMQPFLSALEKGVTTLKLLESNSPFKHGRKYLFILHRLLDHGSVRKVVLMRNPEDSCFLRWLISRRRGPQISVSTEGCGSAVDVFRSGADLEEPAAKRLALDEEKPEDLCGEFSSSSSSSERCPEGQIHSLDFEVPNCEILNMVSHALPTWTCLHTLHVHSDLLSLEKLTVNSTDPMSVQCVLPALALAPELSSLHMTGITLTRHFFHTLAGCKASLKILKLEDINLSDYHQEILHFLQSSVLEELSFKDCRLLDKCSLKTDFMVAFVEAVKAISSLKTLVLAKNRLATTAIEISRLFSGCRPSEITTLDLSSNFILPAELLGFAELLETYRPAQRITLDLCFNPLNRDLEVKGQALQKLKPYCNLLMYDWNTRDTMVDHVSVM
ncbi:leucine-rich repeat-containing protein 41 isoform X2 [Danio rerio]|uniref:Leucine-rich repeat-containing protein 41 n=1 Tax=Danio rerio TaxID=7955 RepID=A0A8M3AT06_DANRE|nr:leucine-rich repeat-containing protein 41 isoform X2 [Danio rerio]|eukprot:XP_009300373.1 leucine-rich repeat-containing protein 41 isoform X2 [Danio rerio]